MKGSSQKEHRFILFLLGVLTGYWGIPLIMHIVYIAAIVSLVFMGNFWGNG